MKHNVLQRASVLDMYTTDVVCEVVGLSNHVLRKLRHAGHLYGVGEKAGRQVLYNVYDVIQTAALVEIMKGRVRHSVAADGARLLANQAKKGESECFVFIPRKGSTFKPQVINELELGRFVCSVGQAVMLISVEGVIKSVKERLGVPYTNERMKNQGSIRVPPGQTIINIRSAEGDLIDKDRFAEQCLRRLKARP